jgi:deoxyadenosine/deoxycytidine kinase
MLANRGEDTERVNDEELEKIFQKHLKEVDNWIRNQTNIEHIDVNYNEFLKDPGPQKAKINRFMGSKLDFRKMIEIIDPALYRQCHKS